MILHCLLLRDLFQGFFLLPDSLVQIRHTLLNLLLNTADYFFLLSREFKEISVYRVRTAAINLGHLLWGEKPFLLNQPGADSKVLFGSCIVLHEIVPMTYSCMPIGPIPCDEVDSVFALNSSQHSAVEIRQHLVAVLQTELLPVK